MAEGALWFKGKDWIFIALIKVLGSSGGLKLERVLSLVYRKKNNNVAMFILIIIIIIIIILIIITKKLLVLYLHVLVQPLTGIAFLNL